MKLDKLTMTDNTVITTYLWEEVKKPKAIIQLIHGATENLSRYDEFAENMNKHGFIVIGSDLRGHGKTALNNDGLWGYFGKDGWNNLVNDELEINKWIKKRWTNLPIFMIGHSLGSLIALTYSTMYSRSITGLVLSGTPYWNKPAIVKGMITSSFTKFLFGDKQQTKLSWKLTFNKFNNRWKKNPDFNGGEAQTRDLEVLARFRNDPLNGHSFTHSGFRDLFSGLSYLRKKKNLKKIKTRLPILLVAGNEDPFGHFGKNPVNLHETLHKLGYNSDIKIYDGQRHEVLFDPKKKIVEKDIADFISKHI